MNYIGIIHKDKNSGFGVSFPDFPGCVTVGDTLDEAQVMAAEALAFHIEGMQEDGEAIPAPSSLDAALESDMAEGHKAVIVVSTSVAKKPRPMRVQVMMDEELVQRIDAVAHNRSAFLSEAAMDRLMRPAPLSHDVALRKLQAVKAKGKSPDAPIGSIRKKSAAKIAKHPN